MNLLNISATDKGAEYFFIKVFTDVVKYRTDNDVVKNDFLDSVIKLMYKGYVEVDDGQESALESSMVSIISWHEKPTVNWTIIFLFRRRRVYG